MSGEFTVRRAARATVWVTLAVALVTGIAARCDFGPHPSDAWVTFLFIEALVLAATERLWPTLRETARTGPFEIRRREFCLGVELGITSTEMFVSDRLHSIWRLRLGMVLVAVAVTAHDLTVVRILSGSTSVALLASSPRVFRMPFPEIVGCARDDDAVLFYLWRPGSEGVVVIVHLPSSVPFDRFEVSLRRVGVSVTKGPPPPTWATPPAPVRA